MKHTYIFIFAAAVMIMTASCSHGHDYDATGIFEATTVTLSAETTGRIMMLDVSEGDSVVTGQRIALIDTAILALQQRQLGSQQMSAESSSPDIGAQAASLREQIAH